MKIFYYSEFEKQYRKLSPEIKLAAQRKVAVFKGNPFDSSLKTHKLHGELEDVWSFSVNYKYRIVFKFLDGKNTKFYFIGTHDIYK